MKLWRITREPFLALDGAGPLRFGGRYSSAGRPVVNLASEAGLAVLIALRYALADEASMDADYLLGWTDIDARPERVPANLAPAGKISHVDAWLDSRRSLLAAVSSAVLPEADVVLLNPAHPDAAGVKPLTVRPFRFSECLHRPPMLDAYRGDARAGS
ncbi:RES family NAD+ phosphorylase [Novosphingobium sp. BL-52-GroH]|uniref:RES family NAD+ phosphorylase n=1 Tax=Novosphingobium sp. BL-52-GroH TaxID=3349877 RepID=UPI00384D3C1F